MHKLGENIRVLAEPLEGHKGNRSDEDIEQERRDHTSSEPRPNLVLTNGLYSLFILLSAAALQCLIRRAVRINGST